MELFHGDCLEVLKNIKSDSVDSLVTDPPAGIGFMNADWDKDKGGSKQWIAWMSEVMRECLRVLKPGAHAFVWAIPRTSHWTATAIEDAGFEIRDVVTHVFGSGFPKSMDISKAIDKAAGANREIIGIKGTAPDIRGGSYDGLVTSERDRLPNYETAPATSEAKAYQGWGTALKPASEHWILCRKPLGEKTIAGNVLKHGVGGLNIDASRIEAIDQAALEKNWDRMQSVQQSKIATALSPKDQIHLGEYKKQGRFPANFVLSHSDHCTFEDVMDRSTGVIEVSKYTCAADCPVKMLDEQSGVSKSPSTYKRNANGLNANAYGKGMGELVGKESLNFGDTGGASRFFYCAKASKNERNAGCEGLPEKTVRTGCAGDMPIDDDGKGRDRFSKVAANTHPTVKAQKLMTYLISMITPPGGVVLDPFMGSGSTGVAALKSGFKFIGIEQSEEYIQIARARLSS